jgi:hypothetical protein
MREKPETNIDRHLSSSNNTYHATVPAKPPDPPRTNPEKWETTSTQTCSIPHSASMFEN